MSGFRLQEPPLIMPSVACACGKSVEPVEDRRFHCSSCFRIYDAREIGWEAPQKGAVPDGEIKPREMDTPLSWYPVSWTYEPEDMERIRWGFRPRSMDDKWAAWVAAGELWIVRSWTGLLCYRVLLGNDQITRVGVAQDMPDHPWQVECAKWVIENRLIGMDKRLP